MLIVAHRGAHAPETAGVRENTLAAFRAAPRAAADGVELDVRRTADGALVVLHDAVVEGVGPLAGTRGDALPDWLPTLADALAACRGLCLVDVEIKNSPLEAGFDPGPGLAAEVAAAVLASPVAGQAVVTSFSLDTVDAVRAAAPALATGWLTLAGYDQDEAVTTLAARGHGLLAAADAAVTESLVARAHNAGLRVAAWTVNDADRVRELSAWGADLCITDRPRLASSAR